MAIWNFYIGGYQVCEKWLKNRKGRKLTYGALPFIGELRFSWERTICFIRERPVWPNLYRREKRQGSGALKSPVITALSLKMNDIVIAGYVPGAIGRITELHATYYARNWDFGLFFESKVAAELSEFLRRFDPERDGFWTASQGGCVEGSIAIDGAQAETEGAHLRWFIVSDAIRGQGTGNRLMEEAVGFCKRKGYSRIFLWTFQGLHPARHLYEKFGFRQVDQVEGKQWGKQVLEQRFVLALR